MHFTCRSFSGNSESKSWSRYWENDPDDLSLKSTKGHLFALININSDEDKDLNSIGHDISYEFNQTYFNSENNADILTNLSQSIDSIIKNPLYSSYKIDFITAVVLDNELYLASFGETKIVFKRQDKISILINNIDNQIETISGSIKNQDRIFLLTNSFFEKITWAKIKNFLSDSTIQSLEENFLSAIYSLPSTPLSQSDLAAALIEIESADQEIITTQDDNKSVAPDPTVVVKKPSFDFSKFIAFINGFKKTKSVFISHHDSKETNKRKKISILMGIILITVLFLSIYFGYQKNQIQKNETEYQALKTEIEAQIENINKTKSLSLDSAREGAVLAQKTIEKMSALKIHQEETESLNSQLKNILSQTGSSENLVADFLFDTNSIISNPKFQKIVFNDNKIYLLDSENGRVDYYDINTKNSKSVLISDKIKSSINLAIDKNNLYLLNKDEIVLIEKNDLTSKIKFDDVDPTDFKFWNSAAYVLDSNNQTIWKFNPNASGFSSAQNWLKNEAKLDLTADSLSINGKIWILYKNGEVSSYLSGVETQFKANQESQFTKTNSIDVTLEKELLTFVDNDNIVYLYQKTGELLSKFNLGNLKVNDLVFNEANNSIYLLCSDQKIYFIKF
ncbi:MAG: hypothetical protein PHH12_01895 [Candidatus Shapirobacteria bacterium]|nr:hypothetical protein [Candidatus Shapirobacteria bacterium]